MALTLIWVRFSDVHFELCWGRGYNWHDITIKLAWLFFVSLVRLSYWSKFHFMSVSLLVLELWQFSFIRDWQENWKSVWVLTNICRLKQARDTKFGRNVSNKMLLNATKCQGYSFYHFWVIKGRPIEREAYNYTLHPD